MAVSIDASIETVTSAESGFPILNNILVKLPRAGLIWIQGPNGSGKSVLASVLSGKAFFHGSGLNVKGMVRLHTAAGKEVTANETSAQEYAAETAFLPQQLGSSLLAIHHQDDVCFGIEGRFPDLPEDNRQQKNQSAIQRLGNILNELNAWAHLTKKLGRTSYGETRRMEFASAISPFASLVVLDEPFSGMDKIWQCAVLQVLKKVAPSYESIWVITSHLSASTFGLTPELVIDLRPKPVALSGFDTVAELATERFASDPASWPEAVQVEDFLVQRRHAKRPVELRQFSAAPRSITWVEGENGSGKSTFTHVLAGLLGSSRLRGVDVSGILRGGPYEPHPPRAPTDAIRLALQNPYASFVCKTVRQDLDSPGCPSCLSTSADSELPVSFCQKLSEAWGPISRKRSAFSFGQLKFLQLLLFPLTVEVAIFDEPLLGLDPQFHPYMLSVLGKIAESGRVVICTSERGLVDSSKNVVYELASPQ
jgi:ABC-type multidrug transport system ATPase subunit